MPGLPTAPNPWQVAQFALNKSWPAVMSCCDAGGADACAMPP